MSKDWLSYDAQVDRLVQRGLTVHDRQSAAAFLSQVSYYRLSGYFRHWQVDPDNKDDRFLEGASFEDVQNLYEAEQELAAVFNELLLPMEILLRTRFAYFYCKNVGTPGRFPYGDGFDLPVKKHQKPVHIALLEALDRSKEDFVSHYRIGKPCGGRCQPAAYDDMPMWVAIEVASFGNLSLMIKASGKSGVLDELAESMNLSPHYLPAQIRSLVYLRNRMAHGARLWNHFVINRASLKPRLVKDIQRQHRNFTYDSVYQTLVTLDYLAKSVEMHDTWLSDRIEPLLAKNALLAYGIATPVKFGEMPLDLLLP